MYQLLLNNDIPQIRQHLQRYPKTINQKNKYGYAPLATAVVLNYKDLTQFLLSHRAYVHTTDNEGNTPLHLAAKNANAEISTLLLNHGANVNDKNVLNQTPLMIACEQNASDVVRLLLEFKADIECLDNASFSAVYYAAKHGSVESLEHVYMAYKDRESHIFMGNDMAGTTPLHLALEYEQDDVVQFYLLHMKNTKTTQQNTPRPLFKTHLYDNKNHNLLHRVMKRGAISILDNFLDVYASKDINQAILETNTLGQNPLHVAIEYRHFHLLFHFFNRSAHQLDKTKLIKAIEHFDSIGFSPLFSALFSNQDKLARSMLDIGASLVNPEPVFQRSIVSYAISLSRYDVVQTIWKMKQDELISSKTLSRLLHHVDAAGRNALHWAALHSKEAFVEQFFDFSPQLACQKDKQNKRPIQLSSSSIVIQLLKKALCLYQKPKSSTNTRFCQPKPLCLEQKKEPIS